MCRSSSTFVWEAQEDVSVSVTCSMPAGTAIKQERKERVTQPVLQQLHSSRGAETQSLSWLSFAHVRMHARRRSL